jgi:hypothetical protein
MALKDINFKQLLIEKGERIGLLAAGAIAALLVVCFGLMSALSGSSPSQNTEKLKDVHKKAQNVYQTSKPDEGLDKLPPDLQDVNVKEVKADLFGNAQPYFVTLEATDTKWRLPLVMAPDEFQVDVVRGAFQTYLIIPDAKDPTKFRVGVLTSKASTELTEQQKKQQEEWDNRYRTARQKKLRSAFLHAQQRLSQLPGGGAASAATQPGGPQPRPASVPGSGKGGDIRSSGFPDMPSAPGGKDNQDQELKFISDDKLADEKAKMAETNLPVRMVVATATFPYKEQLEEFRKALRKGSVDELLRDEDVRPEFAGFLVQRREYRPDGKLVEEAWMDLDLETPLKFIRMRAKELEPPDPQLLAYGIIPQPNRLVIPLPRLAREQKYPELNLEGLKQAIKNQEEAMKDNAPPPPKQKSRLEIDIFDDSGDSQPNQGAPGAPAAPRAGASDVDSAGRPVAKRPFPAGSPPRPSDPSGVNPQRGVAIPDKILVRFLDPTVHPGFSYEYRIKIRMDNPTHSEANRKRAVSKDITLEPLLFSEWKQVTWKEGDKEVTKVHIPDELLFYAADEKAASKDKVPVQVHRWLEFTEAKWQTRGSEIPVGDWSILEKRLVGRGEYIGEIKEVEVATWNTTQERYTIAVHPDDHLASTKRTGPRTVIRRHKGIAVDFTEDPVYNTRPLLVDFRGGEHPKASGPNKPDQHGPVEMLILDADGKLIVRNSRVDTEDKERKDRFDAWQGWINQVKAQAEENKDGPGKNLFQSGRPGPRSGER